MTAAPASRQSFDLCAEIAAWAELFARERIHWVLLNTDTATPALRAGLARAGAKREATLDDIELWRSSAATGEVSP